MELVVLKFDVYPNAIDWLNKNAGVAVRGENRFMGAVCTHVMISGQLSGSDASIILEHLPTAQRVDLELSKGCIVEHPTYAVDVTRAAVVDRLKRMGAIVKTSPCCMEPVSFDEMTLRLQELRARTGQPLSESPPEMLGDLYRKLYP